MNDLNLVAKSNNLIDTLYKSAKHKGISKFLSIIFSFFALNFIENLLQISSYKLLFILNKASAFSFISLFVSFFDSVSLFSSFSFLSSLSFSSFSSSLFSSFSTSILFSLRILAITSSGIV